MKIQLIQDPYYYLHRMLVCILYYELDNTLDVPVDNDSTHENYLMLISSFRLSDMFS